MTNSEQSFELKLEKMAHGGPALGRHEGKVVFVPYTLPGETVLVQIETAKKGWSRARLLEVLEPSPERAEPACPHFGPTACGGCQWQHIAYEAQLSYKTDVVRDQLARMGGLSQVDVHPTRPVSEAWGYRNHAQLHPSPAGLGYVKADGQGVQPIQGCPIMHPLVADLFEEMDIEIDTLERLGLRAGVGTGQQMVIFETSDDEPFELIVDRPVSCVLLLRDGTPVTMAGRDYLTETVGHHDYRISAASFFQVNTAGAQTLVDIVVDYAAPHPHQTLLDLYAGVGLFSLQLADRVGQVIAVEDNPFAAADAFSNAEAAGVDNLEIIHADVAHVLPHLDTPTDIAIIDPPRSGCGLDLIDQLIKLRAKRLVYVACDPTALARDAKALAEGGYRLAEVQPLDLFPQTYHIESVALFLRE